MGPLATIAFFQGRLDQHFALLRKYECNREECVADFDGDSAPGKLFIDYDKPIPTFDSWFVVEDSGRHS
jgi:hypothetical protein